MDELSQLFGAQPIVPGRVFIHVRDCRAIIARYTSEGPGRIGAEFAANWEALEDDAIDEVETQGGGITQSGHYRCPVWLANLAEWEEVEAC